MTIDASDIELVKSECRKLRTVIYALKMRFRAEPKRRFSGEQIEAEIFRLEREADNSDSARTCPCAKP